jgi:hypothetical protein
LEYSYTEQTLTNFTTWYKGNGQSEIIAQRENKQFNYHELGLDALFALGYKIKVSDDIDIRVQTTGMISIIDPETKLSYRWGFPQQNRGNSFFINAGLSISTNYIF